MVIPLIRRLRQMFRAPAAQFDSVPRPIDQVIAALSGGGVVPRISRLEALSIPAVLRGRNLICSVATLPLLQRGPDNVPVPHPLLMQIDPDVPNVVTMAQTLEDLLFESVSWWEVLGYGWDGFPVSARHLDVGSVSVDPPKDRPNAPLPSDLDPRDGIVWVEGKPRSGRDVIRFDSPNPAVLKYCGRAIKRALLLDQAARMYADDPRPQDYFSPADGADPVTDTEVLGILAQWKDSRARRATGYVPASLKYNTVDSPSPADLQLVELQRQVGLDLANALGVDPEELGISTTTRTYANAVDRRRDRINDVLSPYMKAITDRLSMGDVTRRGYTTHFDLDDYMRANPTERWAVYKTAQEMGAITVPEIRAEEGWAPLPTSAAPPPPPVATDEGQEDNPMDDEDVSVDATAGRTRLALDDRPLQFADIPVRNFSVNRGRREIEGLALPYNSVGNKYGLKFRFLRGALKWTSVSRVKLLRDHDPGQAIGKAIDITDMAAGLKVKFKVARGPEGDRALELAEDGVLDGLSVGVDFDTVADTEMDTNDDSVMLVRRADLREVSLTAMPLFDDARVSKVAASRDTGGNTVEDCTTCGQRHAPNVACPTTAPEPPAQQPAGLALSADQLSTVLAHPGALSALLGAARPGQPAQPQNGPPPGGLQLSKEQLDAIIAGGGLGVLLGAPQLTPAPAPAAEGPTPVNPTRQTASRTKVTDPMPYQFDREGNLTSGAVYDFSTDLVSGSKGDAEAMRRANEFIASQSHRFTRRRVEADVDMADAATLNPNINRPDLYVDQRDFDYPMWDAISKGTLANQTPFVLPKFSSSSGLVAAHVEGVEPTPGTFVATSQTITPSAVSGKVEITREAWDQGGNPQLSGIIWRQMTKAWFEALEAAAVALLDAATPTGITLTTAATDDVLVGELESALAALQFVRGGFRMRDLFFQIDLYKALIDAKDGDGRKLLPMLGPVNANGQVSDMFADVAVGGLRGRPGWALAASGTTAASSYLFDRNDVHGWASAPQRLEFQYRVAYVDVAIWGYKATAITDITGVREIIYDPA